MTDTTRPPTSAPSPDAPDPTTAPDPSATGGLDPVLTPARPDVAAAHLRGIVPAERYVAGTRHQAIRGIVPLRGRPDAEAAMTTELLFGETFTAYDSADGWAWGQCDHDGYVGYVEARGLGTEVAEATHRIVALRTFVYPAPDLKRPPLRAISLTAPIAVVETSADGKYLRIHPEGWVPAVAAAPVSSVSLDWTAVAERFLDVPYLWGGRSSLGLDCSGLIQVALAACGRPCPRDTYMQVPILGTAVPNGSGPDDRGGPDLRRGDVVFFPGHVGLMVDGHRMIHANATRMRVSIDPVAEVAGWTLASDGRGITAVRRLSPEA